MIDNCLTSLDFDDLISVPDDSVPDDVIEKSINDISAFQKEDVVNYEKTMTAEIATQEQSNIDKPLESESNEIVDTDDQLSLFENSQENEKEEKSKTNPPTLSPVDTKLDNDNSDLDDTFTKQLSFDDNIQVSSSENTENNEVQNFAITDDILGESGAKTKFKANIAAIETLKILEKENRPATDEEKQTLSRHVGWGGLQNAFDDSKQDLSEEYTQLKELLTDKEYSLATFCSG